MTSHIKQRKHGYDHFFSNTLPKIAFSPIVGTCTSFEQNAPKGGSEASAWARSAAACSKTCMLLPLLLPATLITGIFSLLLAIAAGIASPFVFGVAAIQDCCSPAKALRR